MKKILAILSLFLLSFCVWAQTPMQYYNYAGLNVVPVDTPECRAAFKTNLYAYQIDATYPYTVARFSSVDIDGVIYQSAVIQGRLAWPLNLQDKARYADYLIANNSTIRTDNLTDLNIKSINSVPLNLTLTAQQYNSALRARIKLEIDDHIPCVKYHSSAADPRLDMNPVSQSFETTMGFTAVEAAYPITTTRPVAIIDTQLTDAIYAPHRAKLLEPFSAVPNAPAYTTDLTFKTHMDGMFHIVSQVTGDLMVQPIYGIKGGGTSNAISMTESSIAKAVDKAIAINARVISNSWDVPNGNNDVTVQKFAQAYRKGIMVVQAAGNTGNYNPNKPTDNNVMIVGLLTDFAGTLSFPSERGEFGPDVVVKVNGNTTYPITHSAEYGEANADGMGSSGATAFMAGLIARFPDNLTPDQIKKCIYDTADKVPDTVAGSNYIKHGIVNPGAALEACKPKPVAPITYAWVIVGQDGNGWVPTLAASYQAARAAKCASIPNAVVQFNGYWNNCISTINGWAIESPVFARIPSDSTLPIFYQNTQPVGVEIGRYNPTHLW
jgi:hypothetical protein